MIRGPRGAHSIAGFGSAGGGSSAESLSSRNFIDLSFPAAVTERQPQLSRIIKIPMALAVLLVPLALGVALSELFDR
jgi:hypothetical protein